MEEILWRDHSNETYWAVLSCGTVYYAVQGSSNFWVWMKSLSVTIQMKATEQYFPMVQSITLYKVVLTLDSVDKILVFNYSKETELLSTRIPSCFFTLYKLVMDV